MGKTWSREEVAVQFLSAKNTLLPLLQATSFSWQADKWVALYFQTRCPADFSGSTSVSFPTLEG